MAIVIISALADYHAAAVRWALETADFVVHQWEGLGHEAQRRAWVEIAPKLRVCLQGRTVEPDDVVWYRRPRSFSFHPLMAQCDRSFVRAEARRFSDCLDFGIEATGCRCINPPSAASAINRKAAQILMARRAGLLVPTTMMGNEPQQVVTRLSERGTRLVYKGFLPHVWENSQTGLKAFTVTSEMALPTSGKDEALTYAPGIYQQLVPKLYDARVMVLGGLVRAFLVRSDSLDWRLEAVLGRAQVEEVPVPEAVRLGLREFMVNSGIVFGCFDFAIDEHGCWWFLEVNEAGQFLWIDQMLPEARIFEDFLAFLTATKRESFPPLRDFTFDATAFPSLPAEEVPFTTTET